MEDEEEGERRLAPSEPCAIKTSRKWGLSKDSLEGRVGIHGCRKIYDSVVDLSMKLAQFWYFGHVSKSLVAKSTTAMNPNPELFQCFSFL